MLICLCVWQLLLCAWVCIYFQYEFIICIFHLLLQLSGFGLAGFHLGLVHHVVCGRAERTEEDRKREKRKKVVDKIRASDNAPAHAWAWRLRTLQSDTCCAPTYIHKQMHTHRASVPFGLPIFPLSHHSKSRSVRRLWRHLITTGCHLLHAASTHHYLLIHTPLSRCVYVWERWERTNFPLCEIHPHTNLAHILIFKTRKAVWK